jgi:CheY-like chemotaxis protein
LIEKEEQGVDAFDIILMDLHMPRCGGLECVRKIREQYPDSKIPIVAVTADAMTESRDNCMRDGFTGWLTKPFRIEQIKSLVDDIVTRKQTLEGKQRATSPSAC